MDDEELSVIKNENKKVGIPTIKYNKSVYFLLPMLGLSIGVNFNGLINCYIGEGNVEDFENYHLHLLMKDTNNKLHHIKGYINHTKNDHGIMYKFRIPTEYEEDYLKFILGKYSEFSNDYKAQIYKLLLKPFRDSNIYKVLNKSPEAKKILEEKIGMSIGDQEVLSVPSFESEIFG